MKIKVSETTPSQLDWLVAKCEGVLIDDVYPDSFWDMLPSGYDGELWSQWWELSGPIIEREKIGITAYIDCWNAYKGSHNIANPTTQRGDTPLIAAMRCYVASKLGGEVEIPSLSCLN